MPDSFDDVFAAVDALGGAPTAGLCAAAQAVAHCAQSIDCSLSGYPVLRSALFRSTLGRLAKAKFLRDGRMRHDCRPLIAGMPELSATLTLAEARARLYAAIEAFRGHQGPLAPHLAYGPCTKDEYARLHAMHIKDHLEALRYPPQDHQGRPQEERNSRRLQQKTAAGWADTVTRP